MFRLCKTQGCRKHPSPSLMVYRMNNSSCFPAVASPVLPLSVMCVHALSHTPERTNSMRIPSPLCGPWGPSGERPWMSTLAQVLALLHRAKLEPLGRLQRLSFSSPPSPPFGRRASSRTEWLRHSPDPPSRLHASMRTGTPRGTPTAGLGSVLVERLAFLRALPC